MGYFGKILTAVRASLEQGNSLSGALRVYDSVFDDMYCKLIEMGEISGTLDIALERLATYLEKIAQLKKAERLVSVYFAVAIVFSTIGLAFFTWNVLPLTWGAPLAAVLLAIPLTFYASSKSSKGKFFLDSLLFAIPWVGTKLRNAALAHFTFTFGTLLKTGVPDMESLDITASTTKNAAMKKELQEARKALEQGTHLYEFTTKSTLFPPILTQMIGVGEISGTLDSVLDKMSDYYERLFNMRSLESNPPWVESQEALVDPNYRAFLQEENALESSHPGHLVAYADGARVALAPNADELRASIPKQYEHRALFIKQISERPVKFRRPVRVLE